MTPFLPTVLVQGLLCSPRLFAPQLPALWVHGPVTVSGRTRDDTIAGIAGRILAEAPPRFALAGLSMGGYIALEIARQAPERVARLALLDTSARPDTPEQSERRRGQIARARAGQLAAVADELYPLIVHRTRREDGELRKLVALMAEETGVEAFVLQQTAIIGRADSRPSLSAIRCPTLVLVGDGDELIPPEHSREMAEGIPGARLVLIPGAGHLSTLEEPAAVNAALTEWLAGAG